jgi:hypothetical protein
MLQALQQRFTAALRDPKLISIIAADIKESKLSLAEQINIYHHNYIARISHTLALIYPVCERIVGPDFFKALIHHYVLKLEPGYSSLDNYGLNFADFVADFPPTQTLPYLPDVIRLEWACHQAYRGAQVERYPWNTLGTLSAEQRSNLVFKLTKNASLLCSQFPIFNIWRVNQPTYLGELTVDFKPCHEYLLVWRNLNDDVVIETLTQAEWLLLCSVKEQLIFAEICECLLKKNINIELLLPACILRGWIDNVSLF